MSDDLERDLNRLLQGLTPIEQALILAEALREAYDDGGEWTIGATAGGRFSVTRALPEKTKSLEK